MKENITQAITPSNTYLLMNSCLSLVKIVTLSSFIYQVINGTGGKSEKSWECHFQHNCSVKLRNTTPSWSTMNQPGERRKTTSREKKFHKNKRPKNPTKQKHKSNKRKRESPPPLPPRPPPAPSDCQKGGGGGHRNGTDHCYIYSCLGKY